MVLDKHTSSLKDLTSLHWCLTKCRGTSIHCPLPTPSPVALQPKFLLDSMLGRLCRWLRALGIDAEFIEPGQKGQAQTQSTLIQQIQEAALLQVGEVAGDRGTLRV
jgi:hypothetical protein